MALADYIGLGKTIKLTGSMKGGLSQHGLIHQSRAPLIMGWCSLPQPTSMLRYIFHLHNLYQALSHFLFFTTGSIKQAIKWRAFIILSPFPYCIPGS
jgi:hypothetical protein